MAIGLILVLQGAGWSKGKDDVGVFKYAGGTESLHEGCPGQLELTDVSMTFHCPEGSITAPYSSIRLMQYRPDISRQVRKMKLKWKVKPHGSGGKHNRYFTVVFSSQGLTHIMVLEVDPDAMRPYLAEIDLKAGKRVQVWELEIYDE
ncbi:MAG: hypothetical protein ACRD2O_15915 [Terriglobia bacterium]